MITANPGGHPVSPVPAGRVISRWQMERATRFARPALEQELGADQAAAVLRRLGAEYLRVAPAVPRLRSPMSRMTLRIAVDVLVLYRSLPDEASRECKFTVLSGFVDNWMRGQFDTAVSRWIYRHRIAHLVMRRWLWFWVANRLDEPSGWRFRFHPGDRALFYGVDVTRCGIVRFLTEQGLPELAPVICRGDDAIVAFLPAGVTFRRTQVIAEGAPFCDFRYCVASAEDAAGSGGATTGS